MKTLLLAALLWRLVPTARAYNSMTTYAPSSPEMHGRVINAQNKAFIIGATQPSTHCGLDDASQCPAGVVTLINDDMTLLASKVPGGQFIYIAADGAISYSAAHSSFRPPGAQVGGFSPVQVLSDYTTPVTVLSWQSPADAGGAGLWACPKTPGAPMAQEAVLKAATRAFVSEGCVVVDAVRIEAAGNAYAAWAYT